MSTGFLEESEGVRSATRLAALAMAGGVLVLVVSLAVYIHRSPDGGVIAAVGSVIAGLAAGTWAALKVRT